MKKNLLKKLKSLEKSVLGFIDKYRAKVIGATAAIVLLTLVVVLHSASSYDLPSSTKEFSNTSVVITGINARSGGSGVVLNSYLSYSEILTNKHVCSLADGGGYVYKDKVRYLVAAIKKYPVHDLCLIKVHANLGVNTKILRSNIRRHEAAFISGHPALLPHVLTTGHFSSKMIIRLVVGIKACDENSKSIDCIFGDTIRVVQPFESQLVTGTILPGSSGSAVFNADGKISGLVFAGNGKGLGYAFIVPQEYLVDFIDNKDKYKYTPSNRTSYSDLFRRIFNLQDNCTKDTCKNIQKYMIWRKDG